jgi:predicted nucleotidyltransferase
MADESFLNTVHPTKGADIVPIGLSLPVGETLGRAVQRIVKALDPEKIILFGSYAYGEPTPDSDIDLLVIMHTEASLTERYLSVSRLLRPRPFPVDILVKTPQEVENAIRSGNFFLKEILSRGEILYERPQ